MLRFALRAIVGQWRAAATRRARRRGALVLAALALAATSARAQDFAAPAPAALARDALGFLDSGLPPPRAGVRIEAGVASLFALPELTARAASLAAGWRGARLALGVAQTGDGELGWNAAGLALGGASAGAGAALRAVVRRARTPRPPRGALGEGVGLEAGGGAWMAAGAAVTLWASAPQVLLRGEGPPLLRGLELGGIARGAGAALWLAQRSPPHGDLSPPDHESGVALDLGPCRVWTSLRDRPLRGALGLAVSTRHLALAAAVEAHPVLGETTRLALTLGAGGGP